MKIEIKHPAKITKGGKLIFDRPDLYQQHLYELSDKNVVVIVKESHKKPTNNKYGYYRGCILGCCYKSEYFASMDNKDQIHEKYFAKKFLTHIELVELPGKKYEIEVTRSLSNISDQEMGEFIQKVMAECSHLNIEIPPPEMYYSKYYEKNRSHD